jgi:hypothetical protein
MKRILAFVAALAAISIASAVALADSPSTTEGSAFTRTTLLDFTNEVPLIAAGVSARPEGVVARPDADDFRDAGVRTTFESSTYRPHSGGGYGRSYGPRRASSYHSGMVSQIHAGLFDPDGTPTSGAVFGFRGGQLLDDTIQIGLGADWGHQSASASAITQETPGPGGTVITTRQDIARSSSNLFPVLAYLQVQGPSDLGVIPYFGVGAGYEVLFLSAEDFVTGQNFDGTFGGWGWQLWGGAAFPVSPRARFTAEAFLNQAQLDRDVNDQVTGETLRQSVNMNGLGMRLGLSWGF